MKNWKISLLTAFGFFAICAMVVFNSCEKDPCMDLNCKNNAACSDGLCQCPTGWEGAECDIPASSRFLGTWKGSLRCDNFPIQDAQMSVVLLNEPNEIRLKFPFGNTILTIDGIAETPETHIVTHIDPDVDVHAYVTVDGDLIYVFLETIDHQINHRQICRFSGHRVTNQ